MEQNLAHGSNSLTHSTTKINLISMPAKKKQATKKASEDKIVEVIEEFGKEALEAAIEAFKNGKPIMVFDSDFRER